MSNEVWIRDTHKGDLEEILSIYNDVILNTTAVYSEQPHNLQMRKEWYQNRIDNNFPVYTAGIDGEIAGFSSFGHFRIWPCYRFTVEISVYVASAHRGKGVSKLLLKALIERAKEMKLHAIIAGISADNHVSIQLHQSFDFVEVAHFKEVGFKFGRWLDLKFLERLI